MKQKASEIAAVKASEKTTAERKELELNCDDVSDPLKIIAVEH